jgi:hypothetical protein
VVGNGRAIQVRSPDSVCVRACANMRAFVRAFLYARVCARAHMLACPRCVPLLWAGTHVPEVCWGGVCV